MISGRQAKMKTSNQRLRQHASFLVLYGICCFTPLAGFSEATNHAVPAEGILAALHFPADIEVSFTQQQLNPLIKTVSEQQGVMIRTTDAGLIMRVSQPRFEERTLHNTTVTLKRKKRRQTTGSAFFTRHIELDPNRPSHLVLLALQSLVNGQREILHQHFDMQANITGDQWQITLRPKATEIQKQLTQLQFYGRDNQLTRFRSERINTDHELSHWLDIRIEPPA
jgi:outer membrane lipoprotein carrier protein LolA